MAANFQFIVNSILCNIINVYTVFVSCLMCVGEYQGSEESNIKDMSEIRRMA